LSHFTTATHINFSGEIAFASAVKEALSRPAEILSLLFSVRSTPLLMGAGSIDDMSARLSGLLIGTEIAGMSINASNKVTLISGSQLAPVYSKALEIAGVEHHQVDAEEMVLVGLIHAAQSVWGEGDAANE
jgi:2-dehydro-3-deoxygalactonokinase